MLTVSQCAQRSIDCRRTRCVLTCLMRRDTLCLIQRVSLPARNRPSGAARHSSGRSCGGTDCCKETRHYSRSSHLARRSPRARRPSPFHLRSCGRAGEVRAVHRVSPPARRRQNRSCVPILLLWHDWKSEGTYTHALPNLLRELLTALRRPFAYPTTTSSITSLRMRHLIASTSRTPSGRMYASGPETAVAEVRLSVLNENVSLLIATSSTATLS